MLHSPQLTALRFLYLYTPSSLSSVLSLHSPSTMSSEPENPNPATENPQPPEISKKAAKKEAVTQENLRKKQESATAAATEASIADPLAGNYGDIHLVEIQSKAVTGRKWTEVKSLLPGLKDQAILVRVRAQTICAVSKKMAFVMVREAGYTVQCVLTVKPEKVSEQMVKYATALSRESRIENRCRG